jgi:hypothetical protein
MKTQEKRPADPLARMRELGGKLPPLQSEPAQRFLVQKSEQLRQAKEHPSFKLGSHDLNVTGTLGDEGATFAAHYASLLHEHDLITHPDPVSLPLERLVGDGSDTQRNIQGRLVRLELPKRPLDLRERQAVDSLIASTERPSAPVFVVEGDGANLELLRRDNPGFDRRFQRLEGPAGNVLPMSAFIQANPGLANRFRTALGASAYLEPGAAGPASPPDWPLVRRESVAKRVTELLAAKHPVIEFVGEGGTGKTAVALWAAKHTGRPYQQLSGGDLPTLGHLKAGTVVVVDEAYQSHGRGPLSDQAVSELLGRVPPDTTVILMGYQPSTTAPAVVFPDYSYNELAQILDRMAQDQGLTLTPQSRTAAMTKIWSSRDRDHFGNAREVSRILTDGAVAARNKGRSQLLPEDFA